MSIRLSQDHEDFRGTVQAYLEREVAPHYDEWEAAGITDRSAWRQAGAAGLLGLAIPATFGGAEEIDFRFNIVLDQELARGGYSSLANGFNVSDNIVAPYLVELASPEQQDRWLPALARGEAIGAIAMTEPDAGSDLRGMRTTAVRVGDGWELRGAKTFISNGVLSDVVVVAARTEADARLSLFLLEKGTPGFSVGRKLDKVGLSSQDTAELVLEGVAVPHDALLGQAGEGFKYLVERLPRERLGIASMATASARAALEWTVHYVFERHAFGKRLGDFQATRFTLAEVSARVSMLEAYLSALAEDLNDGSLSAVDAAKIKLLSTEIQNDTVSRCLQLFGGYGYMLEFPIARAFRDSRVTQIYGGANEIMKDIIGRDLADTWAQGH